MAINEDIVAILQWLQNDRVRPIKAIELHAVHKFLELCITWQALAADLVPALGAWCEAAEKQKTKKEKATSLMLALGTWSTPSA